MKTINKVELHEIFEELKNNKNTKFNELYSKYNNLVYQIAFSILKNKENSEDIVQKVFLKIWEIDKSKLPTTNEASWIYSFTKNETLNYLRTKRNTVALDEVYYMSSEDKAINEMIDQDSYNKIISRLNTEEQEIVSLKILSNLSFKEIAQILNKPIATVQWKYYKAVHTLKILISNLSMFIITFTAFIIEKTMNRKKSSNKIEESTDQSEIKENEKEELATENTKDQNKNNQDAENKEQSKVEDKIDNTNNEITENTIVESNTQNINYQDIGILSIAGITLIMTIIFSIIFIKYQQKGKKNVSK